ncbi:MAG: cyclic nucleotide-binding domain-containing protein [Deltaproteobacteria bacterium]|nr:cyclic nucleotide-binding domain-containing protein [Deltaproteobacteria bacterium]MBW2308282.1 cyclic nucleotide-binding domain-containing protein [Deltaproteobacteria bacterium]
MKILRVSERISYREGEIILKEGNLANRLFIIVGGSVRITMKGGNRDEELALPGPGKLFR